MGSKSLVAAPLWAERYPILTRIFSSRATISRKLKSCIIKVLMSICLTTPQLECIFQVYETGGEMGNKGSTSHNRNKSKMRRRHETAQSSGQHHYCFIIALTERVTLRLLGSFEKT
jgi:hypothetical protein